MTVEHLVEKRSAGEIADELRDQCAKMVRLLDDAEWGLASWHQFVLDRGGRIANLLAEMGIKSEGD